MKLFKIRERYTGKVLFEKQADSMCQVVEAWVKSRDDMRMADLRGADLRGADLRGAVLSAADLRGADLRAAVLRHADLSAADMRMADLRGADLRGADLSDAVLRGADLRGADLRRADLSSADLSGAVLSGAVLRRADLRMADLSGADLSGADLSGASKGMKGVPVIKNIHQRVYKEASADGAFDMCDWHTCETTHCRAGWVTHLCGPAGAALEWALGPSSAAAMIYMASDPGLEKMPDFHCSNEEALADMRRLAEREAAASKLQEGNDEN